MRKVLVNVHKVEGNRKNYKYIVLDATTEEEQYAAINHDIDELTDQIKGLSHTTSILVKERARLKELKALFERDMKKKAEEGK